MATNKIHFLAALIFGFGENVNKTLFQPDSAAIMTTNDSIRCWGVGREVTHFTENPQTNAVSWITFPDEQVKFWTKEMIDAAPKMSYGKPGYAIVDEATIANEFWKYNKSSYQNDLLYFHLVQDQTYDKYVRSIIDVSRRYENVYMFAGDKYTGEQIRGNGMKRWSKGLLSELDDQFYVRLSNRYFQKTGEKANKDWIQKVLVEALYSVYSKALADETVKFVSLSDKANKLISEANFDQECWPVSNTVVDEWIDLMLIAMKKTAKELT